jgi:hypothetical protein
VLIVVLALWLVGISLVLRFFSVASEPRCSKCKGELEIWPDHQRCVDCGWLVVDARHARTVWPWRSAEDPVHAIVAAVVEGKLRLPARERARSALGSVRYQRARTGRTRSAKSRTLS